MLLEALAACAGVTLATVATALGIQLRNATLRAEGDLDFRGTLGVDRDTPVGFSQIRLQFSLDSDASDEQLATLLRLTEALLRWSTRLSRDRLNAGPVRDTRQRQPWPADSSSCVELFIKWSRYSFPGNSSLGD